MSISGIMHVNVEAKEFQNLLNDARENPISHIFIIIKVDPQTVFHLIPDKIGTHLIRPDEKLLLVLEERCPFLTGKELVLNRTTGDLAIVKQGAEADNGKPVLAADCQFFPAKTTDKLFRIDTSTELYRHFFGKTWPWNHPIYNEVLSLIPDQIKGHSLTALDKKEMLEDSYYLTDKIAVN